MNRRGFFSTIAKAVAGFTILPAATTYARKWDRGIIWTPSDHMGEYDWENIPNPDYVDAPYGYGMAFAGAMAKALADHSPYLSMVRGGKFPEGAGVTTRAVG